MRLGRGGEDGALTTNLRVDCIPSSVGELKPEIFESLLAVTILS